MSHLTLFLLEIGIAVTISGLVVAAGTPPLRTLLADACGSAERARFWGVYSTAMVFLTPLVFVVVFGKSGEVSEPTLAFFKSALGATLFGVVVALGFVGAQVAGLLPKRR